jgi:hypothetical protein
MKTFYSAEDIEALAAQGITELRLDEDTVLTHLARDTAQRLGVALVSGAPAARAASSAAALSPSPRSTPSMGAKPKGCQHGPLTGRSSGRGGSAGSSDGTVSELIGLVRQLADKGSKS